MKLLLDLLDRIKHTARWRFIPADLIEAGSMDAYCACWLCRRMGRLDG